MRLLALTAIVTATAVIAAIAIADKRSKTEALREAHIAAWLCTHGRGHCDEVSEEGHQVRIESGWNHRERYYVAGVAVGAMGSVALVGLELRRRRRIERLQ